MSTHDTQGEATICYWPEGERQYCLRFKAEHERGQVDGHDFVPWDGSTYQAKVGDRRKRNRRMRDSKPVMETIEQYRRDNPGANREDGEVAAFPSGEIKS